MRLPLRGLLLIALAMLPTLAYGQSRLSGLVSPEAANRVGLVRQWHTNIDVNRASGRIVSITQFVSSVTNHQVFEVVDGNDVYRFTDRDRDAFGDVIGKAGAKSKATEKFNELEAAGRKPVVKTLTVPDVFLYVVTNRGIVHALNGETGETIWVQEVGNPEYPTTPVSATEEQLAVCNGSIIYVLDRRDGRAFWEQEAQGAISTGPALTKDRVSVPTFLGSIETYRVNPAKRYPPFIYRSQGAIYEQPITTPRNSLVWTTDRGHLNVADGSTGKARFRMETSETIIGGAAYLAPKYIYVASFDGYVYCVDETTGSQIWRYSCGSTVSQTPVAVGETVYVVTDEGQLHALDYKTGQLKTIRLNETPVAAGAAAAAAPSSVATAIWPVVSGVHAVIAVSPTKLYCLGGPGQLLILDLQSGRKLGMLQLGAQDIVVHNSITDRLFIGTKTGLLQCLHERQLGWPNGPVVHASELEKLRGTLPEVVQPTETPMEAAPPMPMTPPNNNADPFGADPQPAAEDPFGGPAPMPKPKPAENDPFGAPMAEADPFK